MLALQGALPPLRTCLIVDDSRVIRKVARRILEDLDFEIAEAGDGMEAMAWCRAAMPDVILLDWNMPVMNGIDFLRQLRLEPGGDAPKVVFCTVETSVSQIRAALEAGAAEYIMKPFDGDIIEAKFAQAGLL
jgi:two-component system chemotaxis response regulator CheY